uniref:DENN domain-containing protein 2A-like n=1 Tax=Oncorhynchus gorbuscha TaxID=8017 RepID=UPI001EAF0F96|nr:DENN domain-containing protein 2A-like [Oncorhynchus gorbuscha]
MPAASTMTGGRALLLCTNTDNCIYQSVNGLQCCGLKVEAQSVVPQRPDVVCGDRDTSKRPLSPLVSSLDRPGTIDTMLTHKRTTSDPRTTMENGLGGCSKLNKTPAGLKTSASIRDKISQWEGKKETAPTSSTSPVVGSGLCPLNTAQKEPETVRKKETTNTSEVHRSDSKWLASWDRQDSGKENSGKLGDLRPKSPEGPTTRDREVILDRGPLRGSSKSTETAKDKKSVLTHIKKLEQAMKEGSTKPSLVLPGNYFCPPSQEEQDGAERKGNEPIFGTLEVAGSTRQRRSGDPENVYTEPGAASPSINPLPKPQRTFQHHTPPSTPASGLGLGKGRRNLPPLPSIPPPPLPTCPPPGVCRRPWAERTRDSSNRKSYEFEDLLQSSSESSRVDWYAQSRLGLTRTLSEENVYEDILDPPSKENPYEDIELEKSCLGNKCSLPISSPSCPVPDTPTKLSSKPVFFRQNSERRSFKLLDPRKANRDTGISSPSRISPPSTPSSPDDTPNLSGDPYNRRRRKIPRMVLKINSIFEARRGKKRMKRVSQSTESNSGRVTDENSESESDTEEKLKVHSQRLSSVQSMLRQTGRYRTLERDLMDLQERKLFEYFIVVALHKTKAGAPYLPEVTQQFPLKLERSFKFMRETEDQLKVIPQFCFPDAKDWTPVDNFPSETFSFVLTGEDGSRRFGYCRRLLPTGKSRRLPEVYCIVSRLGCFDLFSKVQALCFMLTQERAIPKLLPQKEVPPEQQQCEQEWSPSLGQEDPEPIQIKEEEDELRTTQEEEQSHGFETDTKDSIFTAGCVKNDCDEDPTHPSRLYQAQKEGNDLLVFGKYSTSTPNSIPQSPWPQTSASSTDHHPVALVRSRAGCPAPPSHPRALLRARFITSTPSSTVMPTLGTYAPTTAAPYITQEPLVV